MPKVPFFQDSGCCPKILDYTLATKESFFMFNNKFYKQVDGVAMGSLSGPALAYIYLYLQF